MKAKVLVSNIEQIRRASNPIANHQQPPSAAWSVLDNFAISVEVFINEHKELVWIPESKRKRRIQRSKTCRKVRYHRVEMFDFGHNKDNDFHCYITQPWHEKFTFIKQMIVMTAHLAPGPPTREAVISTNAWKKSLLSNNAHYAVIRQNLDIRPVRTPQPSGSA